MKIISVREQPEYKDQIIAFLQKSWSQVSPEIYRDCLEHCIDATSPLPQWYVLEADGQFIGCAGLITNDFISRMDLYPWLAALFIDEQFRGNSYAQLLVEKAKEDATDAGFKSCIYVQTILDITKNTGGRILETVIILGRNIREFMRYLYK